MTKRRYRPFLVLTMLLYGDYRSMERRGWHCRLRSTPFAKALGTDTTKLRSCLYWLETHGYVVNLVVKFGYVEFDVVPPLLAKEAV